MLWTSLIKFVKTWDLTMVSLKLASTTLFVINMRITVTINNFIGRCVIFWISGMEMMVWLGIGVRDHKLGVIEVMSIS